MKFIPACLMAGCLILPEPPAVKAGSFEAAILCSATSASKQGRVYVTGDTYRLEIKDGDNPVQLIVNTAAGTVRLIEPRYKRYHTIASRSSRNLAVNPIDAFRLTSGFYPGQTVGQDSIQGWVCEKTIHRSNGKPLMTVWLSTRLGFPLKVVNHRFSEMSFELLNIREVVVDAALMEPPPDFKAAQAAAVPPSETPSEDGAVYEWMVKAGESRTLAIPEGEGISIRVADDATDGLQSRGRIVFHRRADPPLDRYESGFRMPNGRSQDVTYPASALLRAIEFHVAQGGIVLRLDTPP